MLIIKQSQMQSMESSLNDALRSDIMTTLSTDYPVLVRHLTEEELTQRVANGMSRSRKYGLERKVDVISFIVLMFNIAPNFDLYPAVSQTLNDASIPPRRRLDFVIESTSDRQWQEMRSLYDQAAWAENFDRREETL